MKLKTGNPRVRGPRRNARHDQRTSARVEPATFAWVEPLADVDPVVVEREKLIDNLVDRPVYVDRPVEVEKIVEVEKPVYVDRTVEVEKIVEVEKPVFVDRTVEVEKIVEKEVVVEKEIVVEKPVFVERMVEKIVEKPIIVEKEVVLDKFAKPGESEDIAAIDAADGSDKKKSRKFRKAAEGAAVGVAAAAAVKAEKSSKKQAKEPKAIIVGRGPSFASKVGRVMPKPLPVLAGACSLLAVMAGLALMSPSSDNANAERSPAHALRTGATAATPTLTLAKGGKLRGGSSRDPFAAKGYTPPPTAATGAGKKTADAKAKAAKAAAQTRAGAPAAVPTSMYTAALTTYSSYTPWVKARKRAGGWIDFDQKPTVKVLSVGKSSIQLFVVTDVEVIKDKSSHVSYNKPIRQVKMAKGGVVRFADYRDIQGDDVTYTIRYDGSDRIKIAPKQ